MSLARLSVRNPVPVNLLMVAIIVLGTIAYLRLPRELMSDISFNWAFIITPYPGVSAEEIERLITVPIENEIRDVKGIDFISSQSSEGSSFVQVRFLQMSDQEFRARYQDLRAEVDKVDSLPEDAMDTEVASFSSADFAPLIAVHLYGKAPEKRMLELAKELREDLLVVPNVGKVELVGARDREIWVEADPARLRGYGFGLTQVQQAIAGHGLNVPAGTLTMGRHEYLVRSIGEFGDLNAIGSVIVHATPDGRSIRVRDVAGITDTFEEAQTLNRLNEEAVISLNISKRKEGNTIVITDEVKRIAKAHAERHAGAIRLGFTQDSSETIRDIIGKLSTNAWLGFCVVLILLMVVLGLRNAVLAALGIPLSFLACFIFMYQTGESFNGNSLFGLVLVLGIVVDDAIIIVENCERHLRMGKSWQQAAIEGTAEVTRPILSATATTLAAFLPLILLPGIMGKFMRIVPVAFSLALLASMVEAFVILPSHFAEWPGKRQEVKRGEPEWMQALRQEYVRVLRKVLQRRYLFVGVMLTLVPVIILMSARSLGVSMYEGEDINTFQVRVTMPTGTNLETTARTLREFEAVVRTLPQDEVRAVHTTAGLMITDSDWVFRTDVGQLWLDLPLRYDRERSADEIMGDLRGRLTDISGPTSIELARINQGPPVGKAVEAKLTGRYLGELKKASDDLEAFLRQMDGLMDIGADYREGKRELQIHVDPERAAFHGLSIAQVGLSARAALGGIKAASLYDGDEDIDIVVRVAPRSLNRAADVLRLPIQLPTGKTIALGDVATLREQTSLAEIRRYRNQRAVTVSADVDKAKVDLTTVVDRIRAWFDAHRNQYEGVALEFRGEFDEFRDAFSGLARLFVFGLLLIYVILGAQFRSYLQPVVILFTVPFALLGAVVGLAVSGNPISIVTLFGAVALGGVAVNDAIVLISFTNDAKARGAPPIDALLEAGGLRLRPVLLTSATTIAGLLPMAVGWGGMSLTWGPLANTIVWGLFVATVLTLFVIPCVYMILIHDMTGALGFRGAAGLGPGERAEQLLGQ